MSGSTLIFKGVDGSECEQFIHAIRQQAFAQSSRTLGLSLNDNWIADFAATCFTGSALRWYESLSSEVRSSWDLLRNAMLSQYPQVTTEVQDGLSDGSFQPSQPVTDITLPIFPRLSLMRTGRIKVDGRGYISRSTLSNGTHSVTVEPGEALYVRFMPSNDLCNIWLVNPSTGLELLGVGFDESPTFDFWRGHCSKTGYLVDLVRSTTSPKFGSSRGEAFSNRSTVWKIGGRYDSVTAIWTDDAGTQHQLSSVGSMVNHGIYFDKATARSHYVSFNFEEI